MKRIISIFSFSMIALVAFGPSVSAMCAMPFVPDRFWYHPSNNTEALVVYDEATSQETLVVQPAFTANVKDFGLVMPVPSKPTVSEGPENMFSDLNIFTNPWRPVPMMSKSDVIGLASAQAESTVKVIETKNIGTYTATTLTASKTLDLVNWLKENGYTYNQNDMKNISYYVNKGGFYFVTLKVNMDKIENPPMQKCACGPACNALCVMPEWQYNGVLKPIAFTFYADKPMLPLHAMASSMDPMSFTLYTLSNTPWYVPGVAISYADIVPKDYTAPWADVYKAQNKWLVRHEITFNPKKIKSDLTLFRGNDKLKLNQNNGAQFIADRYLLPTTSGIVSPSGFTQRFVHTGWLENLSPILRYGSRGETVKALQEYLNTFLDTELPVTGYFGPKTRGALREFQRDYQLRESGTLDQDTKDIIKATPVK